MAGTSINFLYAQPIATPAAIPAIVPTPGQTADPTAAASAAEPAIESPAPIIPLIRVYEPTIHLSVVSSYCETSETVSHTIVKAANPQLDFDFKALATAELAFARSAIPLKFLILSAFMRVCFMLNLSRAAF